MVVDYKLSISNFPMINNLVNTERSHAHRDRKVYKRKLFMAVVP